MNVSDRSLLTGAAWLCVVLAIAGCTTPAAEPATEGTARTVTVIRPERRGSSALIETRSHRIP